MLLCLTREVSPRFDECELTHVPREPIDVELARSQHASYEEGLRAGGARVQRLPAQPDLPDGVFVEDTVLVLPDVAIVMRPGAASRREESRSVVPALAEFREIRHIEAPGTMDGGDILRVQQTLYVGLSSRTDLHAIEQLRSLTADFGYRVEPVEVRGCLHLKSAVTQVAPDLLLANRGWVDINPFSDRHLVDVDPHEPAAANALLLGERVIYPSSFPRTAERLHALGIQVLDVYVSEIQKAEGGVTCCCVPVEVD